MTDHNASYRGPILVSHQAETRCASAVGARRNFDEEVKHVMEKAGRRICLELEISCRCELSLPLVAQSHAVSCTLRRS